ncbi:hypothetical protein ATB98_14005 [Sinorhizobium saheli]|uniref:Uncharacterized protein n=1 Tax=Sinorhizobium saheli TaxID=36856 RepID=A0A178YHU7_SINSA|nr:hypothetical protein ATB98_14005 [Sinorhizobium saheli]
MRKHDRLSARIPLQLFRFDRLDDSLRRFALEIIKVLGRIRLVLHIDISFLTAWLAFGSDIADMRAGRLVVDEPLANRVRSGRKQP